MPVYEYKALDRGGKSCKGLIDADSESNARSKLRSSGKYPVSMRESLSKSSKKPGALGASLFERIKSDEIHIITRQLATLIGAGIPLINALASLIEQSPNPALKRILAQIRDSVNEGSSLTNALSQHPKLFSNIYINMVRSGEASGSLDIVLERLADFGENQKALQAKLKAALVYPVFMAVIGTGILVFLISYIVPNITRVFIDMERVLPLPTRMLIFASDGVRHYWWLGLLLIIGIIVLVRLFLAREYGRRVWDRIKLSFPITGSVNRKIILSRFASTLGSLLNSGVPLIASLQIVSSLVNNRLIGEVIEEAIEKITKGKSMSSALESSVWFPPLFLQMIGVGEQSGQLEAMLDKVAKAYEREVESAIMGMTALIEPIMISAMGAAVGFVVLSILLPIFEMNQMI
ncbi:MAG: type II secretion system inner membrane protein GspF [Thermodesulfobacteriota bacterium]|nr:type II secretion system inner membrane protein GspF [Thermodesulfobacteriota bacterium]